MVWIFSFAGGGGGGGWWCASCWGFFLCVGAITRSLAILSIYRLLFQSLAHTYLSMSIYLSIYLSTYLT